MVVMAVKSVFASSENTFLVLKERQSDFLRHTKSAYPTNFIMTGSEAVLSPGFLWNVVTDHLLLIIPNH